MEDLDEIDDDDDVWVYGDPLDLDPVRTNVVGAFYSVNEANDLPWSWGISQRRMRQRCTFTRTLGT